MIPVAEPDLSGNELKYVSECVETEWVSSLGKYVGAFEEAMAARCGRRYAVSVCNGTAALHLALVVLGIGPGDEVIVPSLTFVATANAVRYTGATPVFVDAEPRYWQLDPERLETLITPRTKAVIPVDLYGHPVDMDAVEKVARRYGLAIIEDAAEAHGARYKGRPCGGLGDMSCFSFYGNKVITTGEGGMILTDDPQWYERARFLRDHAMSATERYYHPEIGFNYRLTNIQAALGLAQVERIDEFIAGKRRHAQQYAARLSGVPGITLAPEAEWAFNVYWMYSILVGEAYPLTRDELMAALRQRGIDTRPFFRAIHTLPPYVGDHALPVAEDLAARGINLPSATKLTDEQIDYICDQIIELGAKAG
ncbi:MAG: DegT/DnrJ/EryC1/StrS family aminotransferase [Chloroflexi bacterium]|nr:DegT/DnrJ/EryC1/StrS family aminotransferase [Chloroflexota bacterium]